MRGVTTNSTANLSQALLAASATRDVPSAGPLVGRDLELLLSLTPLDLVDDQRLATDYLSNLGSVARQDPLVHRKALGISRKLADIEASQAEMPSMEGRAKLAKYLQREISMLCAPETIDPMAQQNLARESQIFSSLVSFRRIQRLRQVDYSSRVHVCSSHCCCSWSMSTFQRIGLKSSLGYHLFLKVESLNS